MRIAKHHTWLCAGLIAIVAQSGASASNVKFDSNFKSGQTAFSWSDHDSDDSRFSFDHYRQPGIDSADLGLFKQNRGSGKGHKNSNGGLQTPTSTDRRFTFDSDEDKYRRDRFSWSHDGDAHFDDHLFGSDHSTSYSKHYATRHDKQGTPLPEQQTVVPVPAAFWLMGSGLIALVGTARRR